MKLNDRIKHTINEIRKNEVDLEYLYRDIDEEQDEQMCQRLAIAIEHTRNYVAEKKGLLKGLLMWRKEVLSNEQE